MLCILELTVLNFSHGIQILVYNVYSYDANLKKWSDLGYEWSLSS